LKSKCPVDVESIYNDHIVRKNEENYQKRYVGKEQYYHASGTGTCSRKLYYESVELAPTTNPANEKSSRIMRLGTIVHDDLQQALSDTTIYSNTISSNTTYEESIYSKEKDIYNIQKESFKYHIEGEVIIESLNVRGFYDLVAVSEVDGSVHLIDFKTMANYSWSRKFGYKNRDPLASVHQEMQLGTYGLAIKEKFGRLDSMWLYYYNKDNSQMRSYQVPMVMLDRAKAFWTNVNEEHKKGLPMFRERFSPVEDWNCNYCRFLDHCKPPFYKKK
jgi:CRISPR/Cas system-associated exonuclease Cas4 (RecB family)